MLLFLNASAKKGTDRSLKLLQLRSKWARLVLRFNALHRPSALLLGKPHCLKLRIVHVHVHVQVQEHPVRTLCPSFHDECVLVLGHPLQLVPSCRNVRVHWYLRDSPIKIRMSLVTSWNSQAQAFILTSFSVQYGNRPR